MKWPTFMVLRKTIPTPQNLEFTNSLDIFQDHLHAFADLQKFISGNIFTISHCLNHILRVSSSHKTNKNVQEVTFSLLATAPLISGSGAAINLSSPLNKEQEG